MSKTSKKWIANALRWGIAVFGIWYVLNNMSWNNRVLVSSPGGWPEARKLSPSSTDEFAGHFRVINDDGSVVTIPRDQVLAKVDFARVTVRQNNVEAKYDLLAQRVMRDPDRSHWPYVVVKPRNLWQRYWNIHTTDTETIEPWQIVGERPGSLPYPLIDRGIGPMLNQARTGLLIASIFVFPGVFFIVAYRWHLLLKALDIRMTYGRTFVLNMVGSFYNTFMPGSTGGDVLKAYYVSKLTTHRTRAVLSVIIDRVIGLMALVFLGGVMATVGVFVMGPTDPARRKCVQIAIASLLIIMGAATGLLIYYVPALRRAFGLDWILRRLPMQKQVQHAIETMEILRRRPMLILWSIGVTIPVHSTVVLSAMLAGLALIPTDKLHPLYYWVIVPVIVLSGSIPISPQGAGVMEALAIIMTKQQGCTMNDAVALTMSIRIVQILWNLTGGIFVLRGGFHAPTEQEKQEAATDLSDVDEPAPESKDEDIFSHK